MSAKTDALAALDKALAVIPKDGAPLTALDASMVRVAVEHAKLCVERVEELKRARAVRKPKEAPRA